MIKYDRTIIGTIVYINAYPSAHSIEVVDKLTHNDSIIPIPVDAYIAIFW